MDVNGAIAACEEAAAGGSDRARVAWSPSQDDLRKLHGEGVWAVGVSVRTADGSREESCHMSWAAPGGAAG